MPTDPAVLQEALARTAEMHGPGLIGLVTDHGESVSEGAVGVTDLADGPPTTADDWLSRTIVLCRNGIDLHEVLTSDTPFVAAALAGR